MTVQRIPLLIYHSVADDCEPGLAEWTVAPGLFADHMSSLADNGYRVAQRPQVRRAEDYPAELKRLERKGMPHGPIAYPWSSARHADGTASDTREREGAARGVEGLTVLAARERGRRSIGVQAVKPVTGGR